MMNAYYNHMYLPTNGDIFVFGSNLAGRHGLGAALTARRFYGAIYGLGVGIQNNSYAIPTKDYKLRILALEHIVPYIHEFVQYTNSNSDKSFYVTMIGCGLAGYEAMDIAPHFKGAVNCKFPFVFKQYLELI